MSLPEATPVLRPADRGAAASYRWWLVAMLWFVCFLNYADRQAISSVLPLLQTQFGFNELQLGWIGSAFAWVYAGGSPVAGWVADRVSRKALIVWACVGWSFFTLATGWCAGLASFLVIRALTGWGEAFYFPSAMSILSDYHGANTRSRAMAWHQSAVYAGTILGSWMAAVLAERAGWRIPFYVFGLAGILLALTLTRFLREPHRTESQQIPALEAGNEGAQNGGGLSAWETLRMIQRTPAALFLMGGFVCANFVAVIFLTWTPKFLVDKFHYGLGTAGLTGTLYIHLSSAVSVVLAGWLADRLRLRTMAGRMWVQAAGLLGGAFFVFLVGVTHSKTTLKPHGTGSEAVIFSRAVRSHAPQVPAPEQLSIGLTHFCHSQSRTAAPWSAKPNCVPKRSTQGRRFAACGDWEDSGPDALCRRRAVSSL